MSRTRLVACTVFAMLAFAANSLLCRVALKHSAIDPASFTLIRIAAGAATLWWIVRLGSGTARAGGDWLSALALFVYAAGFSLAYVSLTAATGALLLFGAVQATMMVWGWLQGDRLKGWRLLGLLLALGGVFGLLSPGLAAPPLQASAFMVAAGVAWGIYSLRGRRSGDALRATAGNFARAVLPAAGVSLLMLSSASVDVRGAVYAVLSGALASGVGYAAWYAALPGLKVTAAATAQLSVPVIAALAAILLLDEPLTLRVALASVVILGGIALVVFGPQRRAA